MLRQLRWLRHAFWGLLALPLLFCAVEVGMRVYSTLHGPVTLVQQAIDPLLVESSATYQALKPLQTLTLNDPSLAKPVELQTNSYGVRGPEPAVPKPFATYRILCLGDESVFGTESSYHELWTSRLQQYLQKRTQFHIEVINAGVPGFCPLLSYLQYKQNLISLQPDLVILAFQMNDVADDYRYRRFTRLDAKGMPLACAAPGSITAERGKWSRLTRELLIAQWGKETIGSLLDRQVAHEQEMDEAIDSQRGAYRWLESIPPQWEISIRQTLEPIGQLKELTRATSARFLLAIAPAPWQISAHASSGTGVRAQAGVGESEFFSSRDPFDRIQEFARLHQIDTVEPSVEFLQFDNPDRLFLQDYPQYSRLGHALFARELTYHIVEQIPGPWVKPNYDAEPVPISQRPKTEIQR
ncbi:MAG: SGNH/GDSL hydrolase family protein [Planctomycetaceae bacterium]